MAIGIKGKRAETANRPLFPFEPKWE